MALLCLAFACWYRSELPRDDSDFAVRISDPISKSGGSALFDAAHFNYLVPDARGRALADLFRAEGFRVDVVRQRFLPYLIDGHRFLVLGVPLGAWLPMLPGAERPAIELNEIDYIKAWIARGGSLLLLTDKRGGGGASGDLVRAFGGDVSGGRTLAQEPVRIADGNPEWIRYSTGSGLLAGHPITDGLGPVVVFGGQAIKAPPGAASLLTLSEKAVDRQMDEIILDVPGWSQGIAFEHEKGRVVMLADGEMMTALLQGWGSERIGFNRPGNDNLRFARNVIRWLARAE